MPRLDCPCCGAGLLLPPEVKEGAGFACPRCGLIQTFDASARAFRWAALDPFVQAHGASRASLWGGLIGLSLWVVVVAVLMLRDGSFDPLLMLAIAAPYAGLYLLLFRTRRRVPQKIWSNRLWVAMGGYFVYLSAVFAAAPGWFTAFKAATGGGTQPAGVLTVFGAVLLAAGSLAIWRYRRRARALPQATLG